METLDKLKNDFLKFALIYSDCINGDNDFKVINKTTKSIQKIYIVAKNEGLQDFFLSFTNHGDECVRYLSATYLIKTNPDLSKSILVDLMKSNSIIGLNAKTTLDMWQKGMLSLL